MELVTFQYKNGEEGKGWSIDPLPEMDSEKTLILVFAAPEFIKDPAPLEKLKRTYPKSKIMGCSTAGEIVGSRIYDHSLSVAVIRFDATSFEIVATPIDEAEDSFAAGEKIAKTLDKKELRSIFVLSDGLNVNGTELARGLNSLNAKNVIVTGGLAGDGSSFKKTWAIFDGKIEENKIVAVGFYGDRIQIGHGSKGGWDIFGVERLITRSKNNILYELDSKPALALYKEYLGDRAAQLPASGLLFPLSIRKNINDTRRLVRTILAVDEKTESMTFAGDIPQGYLAQLMHANFDRIITGANEAAQLASETTQKNGKIKGPVLAIAISCVGRRLLLGERTEEETESTLESLPKETQQIGFYSYGELSPYTKGTCDLHNQTMTLTTICEI